MSLDASNSGKIIARGGLYEMGVEFSDEAGRENQFGTVALQFGLSLANTAYYHNVCSSKYRTCCVSFSICCEMAKKFATSNHTEPGWIYEVDTDLLDCCGIEYVVESEGYFNPEKEVCVSLHGIECLPEDMIISKYLVDPEP